VALGRKAKDEQKFLPASAEDAVRQAAVLLGKPMGPVKPKEPKKPTTSDKPTVRIGP